MGINNVANIVILAVRQCIALFNGDLTALNWKPPDHGHTFSSVYCTRPRIFTCDVTSRDDDAFDVSLLNPVYYKLALILTALRLFLVVLTLEKQQRKIILQKKMYD